MRLVRPPRLVGVLADDTWYQGFLEARRPDADGGQAFVRYAVAAGMRYLTWVAADHVRPA
jgi:hypothetical protein